MQLLTIDFETYYSQAFSLSKLTTEEYVRSPEFEVIGVAVKQGDAPAVWFTGDHDEVAEFLSQFDWENSAVLAHNTRFDGAILSWLFHVKPKLWLDTLSMARPIHNVTVGGSLAALATHYKLGTKGTEVVNALGKHRADFTAQQLAAYGTYCRNDVELTYKLFKKLARDFPLTELLVIDQTLRMYTEPTLEFDADALRKHIAEVRANKQALLDQCGVSKDDLMSNDKLAGVLTSLGVTPPTKVSARTGKTSWAFAKTDKEFLALQMHESEQVQAVVAARLGTKSTLAESRAERFLALSERGALPVALRYYAAHTGRFGGDEKLNIQNLPSRGDNTLRKAIVAPPGHVILACDSAQIEARTVAWLAGQQDVVRAFADKRDIYSEFASDIYGRVITKADKTERFVGKVAVLSLGYGAGPTRFGEMLRVQGNVVLPAEELERIVKLYRTKNHRITGLWRSAERAVRDMMVMGAGVVGAAELPYDVCGIHLPSGFTIQYNGLRATEMGELEYIADARSWKNAMLAGMVETGKVDYTKIYGGKIVENITQALAAIVIREQMVEIGKRWHVAFQVHDEIVLVVPTDRADEAQADIEQVMSTPPAWAPDLPIACEAGYADNYAEAKP